LTRGHHGAGVRLALELHRHLEIDLLAPGERRARQRQGRGKRAGGRRVEKLGLEGERAKIKTDALHRSVRLLYLCSPDLPLALSAQASIRATGDETRMQTLQSALGIFALLAIAWAFGENRWAVSLRQAAIGLAATFVTAVLLIKVPQVVSAFSVVNDSIGAIATATREGTSFVFGYLG